MDKLVVLDYSNSEVHIYNVDKDAVDEEYVVSLGFKMSNCSWIVGDLEIINHRSK